MITKMPFILYIWQLACIYM